MGTAILPARVKRPVHPDRGLTAADWRIIRALLAVILISVFQSM